MNLVTPSLAISDCIDDAKVLCNGRTARGICSVARAPSILGSFWWGMSAN